MNIHHIYPIDDPLMTKWPEQSRHNLDAPITDCDYIYCASVTQLMRAFNAKWQSGSKAPIICFVWDLPSGWRSWCRDENDYNNNVWRDGDISKKLDLLYRCDKVISASCATQSTLNMYGIESDVLYHFYDSEALDKVEAGEKKNRIIQISRFALNKRFDLTLEAWKTLQDKYPDWELMFIGFGDGAKLRNLAQEMGVERFTLLEDASHTERIKLMKESRILVSPSLHEGFGLSPLEARHCGLATVCSDIPTTEEFDYDEVFFRAGSLSEYVRALETEMDFADVPCQPRKDLQMEAWTNRFDNYMEEL